MGEFSGIEPAGANALLKALKEEASGLAHLASAIRSGAAEAGPDLDPAASGADGTLSRYQRFVDYWSHDLKWRIQIILAMTGGSPMGKHLLTADLPYRDYLQAQREGGAAGKAEGDRLGQLWEQYQRSKKESDLALFRSELAKLGALRDEPYYSGALLKALGKDTLREILAERISPTPGMAEHQGNSKSGLAALRKEIGPLADMFAAADKGGTLPPDVRDEMLGMQTHLLATFLRLSDHHTDQFALDAGKKILDQPVVLTSGNAGVYDDLVAARRILLDELWRRPGVTLMLLQDKKYTHEIYFPGVISSGRHHEYQEELASVLWKTLDQDVGDRQSQLHAWTNLIKVGGQEDMREYMSLLSNRTGTEHPNLAQVLTIRMKPYIPALSFLQGTEGLGKDGAGHKPNSPMIPGITTTDARDFFAGLISTDAGRKALIEAAKQNMREHPTLSPEILARLRDHKESSDFWSDVHYAQAEETGFAGLLLRSARVAKTDHDAQVDFVSDVIGIGAGYTPVLENPVVGAGVKWAGNDPQKQLAELLVRRGDGDEAGVRAELEKQYGKDVEQQLKAGNVDDSEGGYRDNLVLGYRGITLDPLLKDIEAEK